MRKEKDISVHCELWTVGHSNYARQQLLLTSSNNDVISEIMPTLLCLLCNYFKVATTFFRATKAGTYRTF